MNELRNLLADSAIVEFTCCCLFQLLESRKENEVQSLEEIWRMSRENNDHDLILAQEYTFGTQNETFDPRGLPGEQ
jgi:hypothetical protein